MILNPQFFGWNNRRDNGIKLFYRHRDAGSGRKREIFDWFKLNYTIIKINLLSLLSICY